MYIFIAEIKETGIQGEISSPIWYIFYLLPDKKKLDKKRSHLHTVESKISDLRKHTHSISAIHLSETLNMFHR